MANKNQTKRREGALTRLEKDKHYYDSVQERFDSGAITDSYLVRFFNFIPNQLSRINKEIKTLRERLNNGE